MNDVISPAELAAGLTEAWSQRVVAELDDAGKPITERRRES